LNSSFLAIKEVVWTYYFFALLGPSDNIIVFLYYSGLIIHLVLNY
jgi:hypothetical protein